MRRERTVQTFAGLDEQLMPDTLEVTRHEVIHKLSLRCTPRIQDVCGGLGARYVDDRELCLMATCDRDRVEKRRFGGGRKVGRHQDVVELQTRTPVQGCHVEITRSIASGRSASFTRPI